MQIKISVIVPTYNRPSLLKACLRQLCNQSFSGSKYEIIVVSDGPDKQTAAIVQEYAFCAANVRFLSLPGKKGPAAARNVGWQNAKGLLIAFTDDDCLPESHWLENIWKRYNGEEEIAFTGKTVVPISAEPTDFEVNTKGLETGDFVTANCVCTRVTLEAVGGFDEAFTAAWREDSDLEFKLIQRRVPIIKLHDAVVVHPVRKAPWGVSIKEQKKSMFNALLYKKYPQLYRERIRRHPAWRYYATVLSFVLFLIAVVVNLQWLTAVTFISWFVFTLIFTYRRLASTRKSPSHIFEMIATSLVIPFLSVYWTIYGAIKYRVLYF